MGKCRQTMHLPDTSAGGTIRPGPACGTLQCTLPSGHRGAHFESGAVWVGTTLHEFGVWWMKRRRNEVNLMPPPLEGWEHTAYAQLALVAHDLQGLHQEEVASKSKRTRKRLREEQFRLICALQRILARRRERIDNANEEDS